MNGREWLRALVVRQRSKPTAAEVFEARITEVYEIIHEGTTAILAALNPAEQAPSGIITSDRPLSQADVDALRDEFARRLAPAINAEAYQAAVAAYAPLEPGLLDKPIEPLPVCPCVAIYSRCHCPVRA